MPRENKCKCGGLKDKRAKQCTKCRAKDWVLSKIKTNAKRYNKCDCGAKKDKRAKQCAKCKNQNTIKFKSGLSEYNPYLIYGRDTCVCGRLKSRRAKLCLVCERERIKCECIILSNGYHKCTKCGYEGPVTDFWKNTRSINKRRSQCKKCCSRSCRDSHITRRCKRMGLSDKDTQIILTLKTINCEICGRDTGKSFHIDHNHSTGKFRGLLCANCNTGIGLLNDNSDHLKAAIKYLKNTTGKFAPCFR